EPLPNTTFQIKDEDGNVVVEGKTNGNGIATFEELPYGKYTYQEIAAPEGYVIDKNPYPFEIKEDGEVIKAEMENRLIEGSIEITKIDADTEESLEGVEFTLYDESGKTIAEKQTNGEGIVIFEDLKYGKYTMKETKELPNYNENDTVYEFGVDKDGEVIEKTIENKQEESVEFSSNKDKEADNRGDVDTPSHEKKSESLRLEQETPDKAKREVERGDSISPSKSKEEKRPSNSSQEKSKEDKKKESGVEGDRLPNTATDYFNLLLIGTLVLLIGGALSFYNHNKEKKQK